MKKVVDFETLVKLMDEAQTWSLQEVLCFLAMNEIPMSEIVEKLGQIVGVFHE